MERGSLGLRWWWGAPVAHHQSLGVRGSCTQAPALSCFIICRGTRIADQGLAMYLEYLAHVSFCSLFQNSHGSWEEVWVWPPVGMTKDQIPPQQSFRVPYLVLSRTPFFPPVGVLSFFPAFVHPTEGFCSLHGCSCLQETCSTTGFNCFLVLVSQVLFFLISKNSNLCNGFCLWVCWAKLYCPLCA